MTNRSNNNRGLVPPSPVSPELIDKFLTVQSDEIKLRAETLQLQRRELDNSHELAKQSISANLQDRVEQRSHQFALVRYAAWFGALTLLAILVFCGFMAYLNKEAVLGQLMALLVELVKYLVGGVVGYAVAAIKKNTDATGQDRAEGG